MTDPTPGLFWLNAGHVTPTAAVNLASKLLQFATQVGAR